MCPSSCRFLSSPRGRSKGLEKETHLDRRVHVTGLLRSIEPEGFKVRNKGVESGKT